MDFPLRSAILLLQFARGKEPLSDDVVNAAIELLKYVWRKIQDNLLPKGATAEGLSPAELLESLIHDHEGRDAFRYELQDADLKPTLGELDKAEIGAALDGVEPKEFTPSVWIALGVWLAEIVLKKILEQK